MHLLVNKIKFNKLIVDLVSYYSPLKLKKVTLYFLVGTNL